ncbi:hypothetical protein HHK36_019632 [Tetracentron sinense]|uniref:Homeobox domain-containing protein n=1 Tax=Tetracentron sinense TaxID=13715 RepID=A0A834YWQ9_TETSI|nr:hypothetical protein HHK36_019632 [Tetracentron sinense]
MIKGYVSMGKVDDGMRLFDEMCSFGMKPNDITYSTLLPRLCDAEKMPEAQKLLKEMVKRHIAPKDNSIFCRLISCQCKSGNLDADADVLQGMIRLSIPTEVGHYGVLIENFCKAGLYDSAVKLLDMVVEKEIILNPQKSCEMHSEEDKILPENNKKRRLKTPSQVEALETFYNEHKYPTELMKSQVAERLGLSEKQISGWFCHRRLKDKKLLKDEACANGRQDRSSVVIQDRGSGLRQDSCSSTKQGDNMHFDPKEVESRRLYGKSYPVSGLTYENRGHYMRNRNSSAVDNTSSGSSSASQDRLFPQCENSYDMESSRYLSRNGNYMLMNTKTITNRGYMMASGYLNAQDETENAAITAVKRQLGRHYCEDGPPLGVEFQELPPGAFDSAISDPMHGFGGGSVLHLPPLLYLPLPFSQQLPGVMISSRDELSGTLDELKSEMEDERAGTFKVQGTLLPSGCEDYKYPAVSATFPCAKKRKSLTALADDDALIKVTNPINAARYFGTVLKNGVRTWSFLRWYSIRKMATRASENRWGSRLSARDNFNTGRRLAVSRQPENVAEFAPDSHAPTCFAEAVLGDCDKTPSHTEPDLDGIQTFRQPHSSRHNKYSSKMRPQDSDPDGAHFRKTMHDSDHRDKCFNYPSMRKTSFTNYSKPILDGNPAMDMDEDSAGEASVFNSNRNYGMRSKHGIGGMRLDSVTDHRLRPHGGKATSKLPYSRLHNYDAASPSAFQRREYLDAVPSNLILRHSESLGTEDRGQSSRLTKIPVEKLCRERRTSNEYNPVQVKMHPANEMRKLCKRERDEFLRRDNVSATPSPQELLPWTNQIKGSAAEMPTSFSDDETAETSSSMD